MCIVEQRPTLIVLMGLQASGKTTFFERYLKDRGYVHINLDTLKTRNREILEISRCLESGLCYVIDNTNPTKDDRQRYIDPAKDKGYHIVGYFMQSKHAVQKEGICPSSISHLTTSSRVLVSDTSNCSLS